MISPLNSMQIQPLPEGSFSLLRISNAQAGNAYHQMSEIGETAVVSKQSFISYILI